MKHSLYIPRDIFSLNWCICPFTIYPAVDFGISKEQIRIEQKFARENVLFDKILTYDNFPFFKLINYIQIKLPLLKDGLRYVWIDGSNYLFGVMWPCIS